MTEPVKSVVVVGAGTGGVACVAALRQHGYRGRIALIGEEQCLPYQRPPLSKDYLAGTMPADLLPLKPAVFFDKHEIDMRLGDPVVSIDLVAAAVVLASGVRLPFDHLVLASGATPRVLPGSGRFADTVVTLRSRVDSEHLRDRLQQERSLCVVGGGFVGLEVAAVARKLGLGVTVLEAQERLLMRAVSAPIGSHLANVHANHGADVRLGTTVEDLLGGDQLNGVLTTTGDTVRAGLAVVGIGVRPRIELAADAGLETGDGVHVNSRLFTSDPTVSAIGDCASVLYADRGRIRIESIQNATEQARYVAARIAGRAEQDYIAVPWFWSNQYDQKLQLAGVGSAHDHTIRRGGAHSFSVLRFSEDRLVAVDSVNAPADHLAARRLLASSTRLTTHDLADPTIALVDRARAARNHASA